MNNVTYKEFGAEMDAGKDSLPVPAAYPRPGLGGYPRVPAAKKSLPAYPRLPARQNLRLVLPAFTRKVKQTPMKLGDTFCAAIFTNLVVSI